ncbi:MAG: site-specific integrase [Clostridia bacterium]|nr:site-specific integrase [Clostridia bacterium]
MSKEVRRVIVGYNDDGTPVIKRLTAANQYEMNDRIVQEYVSNGRIREFLYTQEKPKPTISFKDYAERWLDTYIVTRKPNTIATYKKILRAILPDFGNQNLADITTNEIQLYLNKNKDLSKKTLKERLARIAQILDSAKEDGLIDANPAKSRRLTIPTDKQQVREAIPLDVMRVIIQKSAQLDEKSKRLLLLLITTGGRRGEVLGLQWQDIDVENNLIHIRRNVTHANGNVPVIGTPKTKAGTRDVPYEAAIRSVVDPTDRQPDAFILEGSEPTQPMTMTMYNNTWHRILKQIPELKPYSAHYFRHTYATLLSEYTDATPKTIQALAGHKDIRTTMSIYEHSRKENLEKANIDMHNLLFA